MESKEGINSRMTVIAPEEAPSIYHVIPASAGGSAGTTTEKKKRGRPRKYGGNGTNPTPISSIPFSASAPPDKTSAGQPYTIENKYKPKVETLGEWVACSTGGSFLPHMITIDAGEDVSMKIVSFCQQGPRAVCIISAAGLISNVSLRQPSSSGGTLTYEGRFEILSLSGSFTPAELGGTKYDTTGRLSVLLVSPDGRVIGGTLAGFLTAATPVQVVVGSFLPSNYNELKPKKHKYQLKEADAIRDAEHHNFNPQIAETPRHLPSSTFQKVIWGGGSSSNSTAVNSINATTDMKISLQGQ